jgi:hypothetical protein
VCTNLPINLCSTSLQGQRVTPGSGTIIQKSLPEATFSNNITCTSTVPILAQVAREQRLMLPCACSILCSPFCSPIPLTILIRFFLFPCPDSSVARVASVPNSVPDPNETDPPCSGQLPLVTVWVLFQPEGRKISARGVYSQANLYYHYHYSCNH